MSRANFNDMAFIFYTMYVQSFKFINIKFYIIGTYSFFNISNQFLINIFVTLNFIAI